MTAVSQLMLEVGVVMLIAFLGAAIAARLRLSVIIGYIVAGILIGPNLRVDLFGWSYGGLIRDDTFIQDLSHIGLILLLFFVGLGFSVTKLRKTKEAAIILALMNLGLNMFVGFVIGTWLGWPLIDTIFLAGVISMSSSAVTAKSLIELKRLGRSETEFLLGMVILESFMAMFLLTLVNGMVVTADPTPIGVPELMLGMAVFIGFFALLAAVVIPRTAFLFERIKSEELFVLFALGIVFLAAALAEAFRIPAIIGAFFIGMVFADTKLVDRFQTKIEPIRDAFVAVFFLSFGMLIDPAMFPGVVVMIAIAIPLIFLNDLFLTSSLAFFIGFSGRSAAAMGSALIGRNEEAILYASVGTRAITSNPNLPDGYGGTFLNPFAGILCIAMSMLAPVTMRRSERFAAFFARRIPKSIAFGGDLVKRTLRTFVMPTYLPLYRRNRTFVATLIGFAAVAANLVVLRGPTHLVMAAASPLVLFLVWKAARRAFREPVRHTNYGIASSPEAKQDIERFVLRVVVGALAATMATAILWPYYWPATLFVLYGYFLAVVLSMKAIHRRLVQGVRRPTKGVRFNKELKPVRRSWERRPRITNGRR